jgi:hypothetical protein
LSSGNLAQAADFFLQLGAIRTQKGRTNMTLGNESLDPRAIATAPTAGLNATKLFLNYQAFDVKNVGEQLRAGSSQL